LKLALTTKIKPSSRHFEIHCFNANPCGYVMIFILGFDARATIGPAWLSATPDKTVDTQQGQFEGIWEVLGKPLNLRNW
jgi:hypothetical protein